MGILLVLGVFVLAFLCGRLQITVNHVRKDMDELRGDVTKLQDVVEDME